MSNFQKRISVFKTAASLCLSIMLCMVSSSSWASASATVSQADSLFQAGKYTESFELYDQILRDGDYSPSMLLKMSFIREGLGDVSGALYYLNLYYNQTSNKKVLIKLQEMAEENQLTGYDFGDRDFFINLYHQYHIHIQVLLLTIALLLVSSVIYDRRKGKPMTVYKGLVLVIVLSVVLYLNNYGLDLRKGIIIDPQTYLMTGPSGASDVFDVISKGHRVDILGVEGIWVKIRWADQEVYVRQSKIKRLS